MDHNEVTREFAFRAECLLSLHLSFDWNDVKALRALASSRDEDEALESLADLSPFPRAEMADHLNMALRDCDDAEAYEVYLCCLAYLA